MLPFESISKALLFLHLVAAFTAAATAVHLLARLAQALRGRWGLLHAVRLHSRIILAAYGTTYVLGALIYPTFRIRVRHEYLDRALPWATALFEIKEDAATIALLPAVGVFVLAHRLNFHDSVDRRYLPLFTGMVAFVLCVLLYNAWTGWYLSSLRSI